MYDVSWSYSKAAIRPIAFLSHVITITSETGVGSSTTLKKLREHYGPVLWRYISGGSIMRARARERGMTIDEFAAFNREHPEAGYDLRCDQDIREYGKQNHTILEGRLTHAFVPHGMHVLLKCPVAVRAERRQADEGGLLATHVSRIEQRDRDDRERYQHLYPGCLWSETEFDLELNTSILSPADVVQRIVDFHVNWQRQVPVTHVVNL